jgi:hypothetical protein
LPSQQAPFILSDAHSPIKVLMLSRRSGEWVWGYNCGKKQGAKEKNTSNRIAAGVLVL